MKVLKYIRYLIKHKWYVFIECCKMGMPLRGILHDLSKLSLSEFIPYMERFYGDRNRPDFDYAWLKHQKRNPHHWQYWILQNDEDGVKILPIPDKYRKEMLCDWKGAGKAQGFKAEDDCKKWYLKNKDKIIIHDETRRWIEEQLL